MGGGDGGGGWGGGDGGGGDGGGGEGGGDGGGGRGGRLGGGGVVGGSGGGFGGGGGLGGDGTSASVSRNRTEYDRHSKSLAIPFTIAWMASESTDAPATKASAAFRTTLAAVDKVA